MVPAAKCRAMAIHNAALRALYFGGYTRGTASGTTGMVTSWNEWASSVKVDLASWEKQT